MPLRTPRRIQPHRAAATPAATIASAIRLSDGDRIAASRTAPPASPPRRQDLALRDRQAGARDVVEQQRLHAGLADPAGEGPAALGEGRRGAQPQRRFVAGIVEVGKLDDRGRRSGASGAPSRRRTAPARARSGWSGGHGRPQERDSRPSEPPRSAADRDRRERHDHEQAEALGEGAARASAQARATGARRQSCGNRRRATRDARGPLSREARTPLLARGRPAARQA